MSDNEKTFIVNQVTVHRFPGGKTKEKGQEG